jgi:hypothetical protein
MSTAADGHREAAVAALANREYRTAGDEYSRAAWAGLSDPRQGQSPFELGEKGWVGTALGALVAGVISYRVAGLEARATRRAVEGVAVARDLRATADRPVQQACLSEFVGDYRVVGGLDGVAEAYESAATAYESAADSIDSPQAWGTTPLFEGATTPLQQLARGQDNGEIAIPWERLHGDDPGDPGAFLAHRVQFKRQRYERLLATAVERGYLAAPRGTTEYNNDTYRCPNCDSTDVNWVADNILCMRCSTPTERRDDR